MKNAKVYCLCLHDNYLDQVKELDYIPVGLGENIFSKDWIKDSSEINISEKNSYYGEYSFHYWLWKNELKNILDNTWIGFCTYRRFWQRENKVLEKNYDFKESVLKKIPIEWNNFDVILANKISIENIKWLKVLKYGKIALCRNPGAILKKNRNIRFQFDMFHGNGMLDKAIKLLNANDKKDFQDYINKETSFNPANMFFCKSKDIMKDYYKTLFEWLDKCEKVFGFDLKGYGKIRIYAFLAERFMPYWFKKNAKVKEWPILFRDLNE